MDKSVWNADAFPRLVMLIKLMNVISKLLPLEKLNETTTVLIYVPFIVFFIHAERASSLLINLEVTVRNLDECNTLYSAAQEIFTLHYPQGFDESILCASGENGNDVCRVGMAGKVLGGMLRKTWVTE